MTQGIHRAPAINPGIIIQSDGVDLGLFTVLDLTGFGVSADPASGTLEVLGGINVLGRNVEPILVTNTAVETTLASFEIPAGTLDVNGRKVILEQRGDLFCDGANRNITFRIYVGGVVAWASDYTASSVSARRPFWMRHELQRIASASQNYYGSFTVAPANATPPSTGTAGTFSTQGQQYLMLTEGLAHDESAPIPIRITQQMSVATSNFAVRQQTFEVFTE